MPSQSRHALSDTRTRPLAFPTTTPLPLPLPFQAYVHHYLPGLNVRFGVASVLFRVPFLRQFFLWLGCIPADKHGLTHALQQASRKTGSTF